jgi:hypothetical protein
LQAVIIAAGKKVFSSAKAKTAYRPLPANPHQFYWRLRGHEAVSQNHHKIVNQPQHLLVTIRFI